MSEPDLFALLQEGQTQGVYPSARAVVVHRGDILFEGGVGEGGPTALFDLASLTKVMATTAIFTRLWARGVVSPELPVAALLPDAAIARTGATLADLLTHRSGLAAGRPLFLDAFDALTSDAVTSETRTREAAAALQRALDTSPEAPLRSRVVYSDLGFIALGRALELAGGAPLDALFTELIAEPLQLSAHFRRLSVSASSAPLPLPTGDERPRPPEPGQDDFRPTPVPSPRGEVDDDNAWALDGVAGHAGLFGTAHDVAAFGEAILEDWLGAERLAPQALWRQIFTRDDSMPGSTRTLGFDTPSAVGASAGPRFGPRAVGHLGFTGTSLWIDLGRALVVALVTNRVALGRAATRQTIRDFRPRFHDAVLDLIGVSQEPPRHG